MAELETPIQTLLSAGQNFHCGEARPLNFSSGSPCPAQPPLGLLTPLPSLKYLAIKGRGRAKVWPLRMKKKKPAFSGKMQDWRP